jgi:hypothetical protein
VIPLDAVSNAVRHVAQYVAARTSVDQPLREIRPASIEVISGGQDPRRRARRSV